MELQLVAHFAERDEAGALFLDDTGAPVLEFSLLLGSVVHVTLPLIYLVS